MDVFHVAFAFVVSCTACAIGGWCRGQLDGRKEHGTEAS
jgi:hypothetical protein